MYYLDTSAVMKLIVDESDSRSFRTWFAKQPSSVRLVSCDLARTELLRASRRVSVRYVARAREVLDSLILMTVPTSIFERAALLPPAKLRSLDAIHLASALALGDELRGFVTYDEVLAESATQNGLRVTSP